MEDKEYLSPAKEGFGGQDEQFYYGIRGHNEATGKLK